MKWCSLVLFFYFSINSCSKATTDYPSYIKSDSSQLKSQRFGDPTSSIYGLQISIGNDDRGSWQFPFLMPVLREGIQPVFCSPIVKINDLSTLLNVYPFYKPMSVDLKLVKSKILDTIINFEYIDSVQLLMQENMEVKTNFNNSDIKPIPRLGLNSMEIKANSSSQDTTTTSFYYKPIVFNPTKTNFLELDYKMSQGALGFGMAYTDANGNISIAIMGNTLQPTTNWKHVYIDLFPMLNRVQATQYTPVFLLITTNGASQSTAYIDNIKILSK